MPKRNLLCSTLVTAILCGFVSSCGGPARTPPKDAHERFARFLAAGDTASAIRHIERVNLKRARDPSLYVLLGRLQRERGTIKGRLESQMVLERALQVFPGNPDVLMELGKTYFAQTFYPDAIRCFNSALDVDPNRCEAHAYIGLYHYNNWKRVNTYTDDLTAARRHFAAAVECDSSDLFTTVKLAFSLYALDRKSEAANLCESAIERFPDAAQFYMLRGAVAYEDERFDDAMADFDRGLALMESDVRDEYADLFDLLSYDERFLYEDSEENRRRVVERSYWIDLDPDPTTAINEMYLEHIYRMFIADVYFSCYRPQIRGWHTERGATVVKFGWPWQITSTMGGSWDSGRVEEWYYIHRHKLRQFVFEDEYLSGNLRIPLYADSMVAALRFGPRVSSYLSEAVSLPGAMDVSVFKNDEFSGTLYISAKIDADSLRTVLDLDETERFFFRGALFDDDWIADYRFADTLLTGDIPSGRDENTLYYFLVRDVTLPFDSYHVACTFEDQFGVTRATFKSDGDSFRFTEGSLSLSDVLYQHIPPRDAVSFRRSGKRLSPNPGRSYGEGQRLSVYFEVYGLRVSRRLSDYDVTYHIYESPEDSPSRWRRWGRRITGVVGLGGDRDPAISQTINRQGYRYTGTEQMTINIDSLKAGRYELVVTVVDKISGETAHAASVFFKNSDASE